MKIEKVDKEQAKVEIINSIQVLYKQQRQNSKAPSFALQYFCQPITLQNNNGFSEEKANKLHSTYHEMYKEYFEYIDSRLYKGITEGYVLLANGVRLLTPALNQGKTGEHIVDAEYRSVGNAISQSYGSLTTRAARLFMEIVWKSEYKHSIKVINIIHDAIYIIAPKTPEAIQFVNQNLIPCMCDTSDYTELDHPIVKLEAELDVRTSSWAKGISIINNASLDEIGEIL